MPIHVYCFKILSCYKLNEFVLILFYINNIPEDDSHQRGFVPSWILQKKLSTNEINIVLLRKNPW